MPKMPQKPNGDQVLAMNFPVGGIDLSRGFAKQAPRPLPQSQWGQTGQVQVIPGQGPQNVPEGVWGRTCVTGINVRGYQATSLRRSGGTRNGLAKYLPIAVGGISDWVVQDLDTLTYTGFPAPGGVMPQQSQSGRVVLLVAVQQGNVYVTAAGGQTWTASNNGSSANPPLNFNGIMYSSALGNNLYFADGTNYRYLDATTNTVFDWTASVIGSDTNVLPVDSDNNTPRLICTWRERIVLSGLLKSPQQLFMSAIGDATNFDYFPADPSPASAFATTIGPQGQVGDVVTALIPFSDDVLIVGTNKQIWVFNGDPQAGGQLDKVTQSIGIVWGQGWCQDPYGTIYFMSNSGRIYSFVPGQAPQPISQQIEQLLLGIDTGNNVIRLAWDDRFQGVHVFVTNMNQQQAATHFFYEARTGAWWLEVFTNSAQNPLAVCEMEGNTAGDRVVLMGGWDGYVRGFSPTATDDDGTPISSSIIMGPFVGKTLEEILWKELQAVMSEDSGDVAFGVLVGQTAELAASSSPLVTGIWGAGRNATELIRRAGHALYLQITSTASWAVEQIRVTVADQGKVRRRSKF
jgi:hypothetical protein